MNNASDKLGNVLRHLDKDGFRLDSAAIASGIGEYVGLIRQWNAYASLVSIKDAESNLIDHCVDSLSLLPAFAHDVNELRYVDIGSGGGFPAIPICIAMPEMETTLIERSTKKTTFLRKVTSRLKLSNVAIENRSFDGLGSSAGTTVFTSRAVERPVEVIPDILRCLEPGDRYLCQSEAIHDVLASDGTDFVLEPVSDDYASLGFRRSTLYVVTRA